MAYIHDERDDRNFFRPLLLTWALSAGYFLLFRVTLSMLPDSFIGSTPASFGVVLALTVPVSTAILGTFLTPHPLINRFMTCCVFSIPAPLFMSVGTAFMIPSNIPYRELYALQTVAGGLLLAFCGTIIGWIIRRRK